MKIAVLGLGLIGGSIGLAARAREGVAPAKVRGWDPDRRTLAAALAAGAIDEAAADASAAVAEADVVFVAAPIGALTATVSIALRCAPAGCVVTDVGSTKRALLCELQSQPGIERFVGGHPLAGSEQGGIENARPDLFEGAAWCLTPAVAEIDVRPLRALIEGFGARTVEIDVEAHDRLMARISHLPHVLANVLVAAIAGFTRQERALAAAGPSFRDATRVAGASTAIWTDIYISNADMLIAAIDEAVSELEQVRAALADRDARALRRWNESAREWRRGLAPQEGQDGAGDDAA